MNSHNNAIDVAVILLIGLLTNVVNAQNSNTATLSKNVVTNVIPLKPTNAPVRRRRSNEYSPTPFSGEMPKIATGDGPKPAIHGPRIYGSTPGKPFLFLIPATGEAPLNYAAQNLPEGLKLDPKTGIISGSLTGPGESVVTLTVSNARGKATRELKIVGGTHKLALTPPMGWNSWNIWATTVSADNVKAAADDMVASGLAAHGYQYVCIDDTWEAHERGPDGQIMGNEKFGDMKALADYVHSKGLKIGIYSSPGPRTCAGYPGSYQHELQDAQTWAAWGMDYVKYDWCDYQRIFRTTAQTDADRAAPYALMTKNLDLVGRDMPLCIGYAGGNPYNWGEAAGGSLWRTWNDISDNWQSLSEISAHQVGLAKYAGPGHWNDPDMLIVGKVGFGPNIHPTRLNPNEQMLHITLWSLLAAPLLVGCDMGDMDSFTKALLMNDEVLDVDQDPLGKQAGRVDVQGEGQVWARPLSDGTTAVGLLNFGDQKMKVTADFAKLGLTGRQQVRDLWRQKNLGRFSGSFSAEIPVHGAVMVKIGTPKPEK